MQTQEFYDLLDAQSIAYERFCHEPVFTMEGLAQAQVPHLDRITKNLFLVDSKKNAYYLLSIPGHIRVSTKKLAHTVGAKKLRFAREEELFIILGLQQGEVTPAALIAENSSDVTLLLDRHMSELQIGVHPLTNTETVFLEARGLIDLIEASGKNVVLLDPVDYADI